MRIPWLHFFTDTHSTFSKGHKREIARAQTTVPENCVLFGHRADPKLGLQMNLPDRGETFSGHRKECKRVQRR